MKTIATGATIGAQHSRWEMDIEAKRKLARRAVRVVPIKHWPAGTLSLPDDCERTYRKIRIHWYQESGPNLRNSPPDRSAFLPDIFDVATMGVLRSFAQDVHGQGVGIDFEGRWCNLKMHGRTIGIGQGDNCTISVAEAYIRAMEEADLFETEPGLFFGKNARDGKEVNDV